MSVIIMEGPDGCGKTNIGKRLAQELGWDYFKVDSEKRHWAEGKFKEALEFDQTYLVQFLEQVQCDVVIDRAYPSEFAYSAALKRDTNMEVLREVDRKFAALDAVIIILLRHDYSKVEDELVLRSDLSKIHHMYWAFYSETDCRVIVMHVDDFCDDIERQMPRLLDALTRMDQDEALDNVIIMPEPM
jgi:thymidylate kinase